MRAEGVHDLPAAEEKALAYELDRLVRLSSDIDDQRRNRGSFSP